MTTLMQTLAAADEVRATMEKEIGVLQAERASFIKNMDGLIRNLTDYVEGVKATVAAAYDQRMSALATIIGDPPAAEPDVIPLRRAG